jgi:hypothetical protein
MTKALAEALTSLPAAQCNGNQFGREQGGPDDMEKSYKLSEFSSPSCKVRLHWSLYLTVANDITA